MELPYPPYIERPYIEPPYIDGLYAKDVAAGDKALFLLLLLVVVPTAWTEVLLTATVRGAAVTVVLGPAVGVLTGEGCATPLVPKRLPPRSHGFGGAAAAVCMNRKQTPTKVVPQKATPVIGC
mmetsp:Transcript_55675/g.129646  ORF Transcript_55675/g.129646 Transcript_55675/m.129646 type:complete len:123 (+) Transcript_55675:810-1178(+)